MVFWNVTPWNLVCCQRFGGSYRYRLQGQHGVITQKTSILSPGLSDGIWRFVSAVSGKMFLFLIDVHLLIALMIKAARTSQMSVKTSTRVHGETIQNAVIICVVAYLCWIKLSICTTIFYFLEVIVYLVYISSLRDEIFQGYLDLNFNRLRGQSDTNQSQI